MSEAIPEDLMQAATDLRNELALAEPRVDEATVVKIIARALMAERTRQEERVRVLDVKAIVDLICDDVLPAYGISSEVARSDVELPAAVRAALGNGGGR
jgi:hypothetical protein